MELNRDFENLTGVITVGQDVQNGVQKKMQNGVHRSHIAEMLNKHDS